MIQLPEFPQVFTADGRGEPMMKWGGCKALYLRDTDLPPMLVRMAWECDVLCTGGTHVPCFCCLNQARVRFKHGDGLHRRVLPFGYTKRKVGP